MLPHADLPDDYKPSPDSHLLLSIPTDEILSFRSESYKARDQSVAVDWTGKNRTVVISDSSRFGSRAVYGELGYQSAYPLAVVPDNNCNIWSTIDCPEKTERRFAIEA